MSESEESAIATDTEEETEDCFEFNFESIQPYEDEPLASEGEGEGSDSDDEPEDEDGIPPSELEARSNGTSPLNTWCKCGRCDVGVNPREFRCCKEVKPVIAKLVFDGSIEQISCVCQHIEYGPLTHRAVLLNVGPLLKGKDGKRYKLRSTSLQSENEFCRAVAYRWLIRWMCGYIGWENTRPLPACIYKNIRTNFPTTDCRGFQQSEQS